MSKVELKLATIMNRIVINVENASILPSLRKVLGAIDGISIIEPQTSKKTGLDEALDDVREGRINHYDSAEEMFKALGV